MWKLSLKFTFKIFFVQNIKIPFFLNREIDMLSSAEDLMPKHQ